MLKRLLKTIAIAQPSLPCLKTPVLLLLLTASYSSSAQKPNWHFFEAQYLDATIDERLDADGYAVTGAYALFSDVFIIAQYEALEVEYKLDDSFSNADINRYFIGLGYNYEFNEFTEFYAILALKNIDYQSRGNKADNDGYAATLGLRSFVAEKIELNIYYTYLDIDYDKSLDYWGAIAEDSNETGITGLYHISKNVSLGLGFKESEGYEQTSVSIKYHF
ncbi:hypothetical protein [Thalassotalea sp. ND16A]|uniref:hypothetical protein n=1 Tax=Thalassotalea sp. ND16A TaxID=1535422 RepID=UPI00051A01A7|nr:hypothetical protein [Thalassotalea sp. ND16A]KGJ95732.1 hypothetical protein ND16A_1267 [Thalassotalea sp. ND16A]